MRPKTLILFFVAIGCGLVASIGVSQYMEKARESGGVKMETMKVFVAANEININEPLDEKNVKLEEWPKDRVPEGAVQELKQLEGKYARTRLYKGEPLLTAKLSDTIDNIPLTIPDGYRVVTVKVNAASASGGLIRPGDRVDLVVFIRKSAEVPETTTKTILRDVNVFACDSQTERDVDKGTGQSREVQTVSLLVKPNQAEAVTLAKELGTMSLTLRRPGDANEEISDGVTVQSLLGSDGESANEKKEHNNSESGLTQWLAQGATQFPVPGSQVVLPEPIPEEPAKFTMKIRTPNGDREYRWKDLAGEPEERGPSSARPAPPEVPARPIAVPIGMPVSQPGMRAIPQREPATTTPPDSTGSEGDSSIEKQDN
jgi:pilus assembly protein CpaB